MNNGDIFQFYKHAPGLLLSITFFLASLSVSFPIGYLTYGLLALIEAHRRRR